MQEKYFPNEIEPNRQRRWATEKTFQARPESDRPKFYCLEMLAYTSGRAHIGHISNYAIGDALAWYKRMRGFNVLHPFGWDAFGQPAETAAIKEGIDPEQFTRDAIATMKHQLIRMGMSYDWSREVATCDPAYYKWNQWFFIRMWERGMLYRKLSPVNWCPKEDISLSNEQASGGTCWRCNTPVIQKELMQWFARITDYADELLAGLDQIQNGWPDRVVTMQRNWIGRSEGSHVDFKVEGLEETITVFTTRIDTIFGANAIVLAPEHSSIPKIAQATGDDGQLLEFAERLKQEKRAQAGDQELEKQGRFTGAHAINPFNQERLPIWVANFVLIEYGTGAIMAVPAGDERDFEFSRKYNLPFRQIKLTATGEEIPADELEVPNESWTTTVNSGEWSGVPAREANQLMTEYAEQHGFGKRSITYRIRDWGISRQRYWGTPVPMIHCEKCGIVPVSDDQLPVVLPTGVNLKVEGGSPLDHVPEFVNVPCPKCGGHARRDTDTMDTFVDSNWYYFRYCDPNNDRQPFDPELVKYWMPVDQYIGGIEHAVLHLIYTRYWNKVMRDMGLVQFDEPISRLLTQGMVLKETFWCDNDGWLFPEQVTEDKTCLLCGKKVVIGAVEKMSKSKKNAVDPIEMVNSQGADALRLFVLFAGPPEKDKEWSDTGFEGAARYLQRIWRIVYKWHSWIAANQGTIPAGEPVEHQRTLRRRTHQIIRSITENFDERLHLNTCVSSLMELTNEIYAFDQAVDSSGGSTEADVFVAKEAIEALVRMLTPFAPHIAEELWENCGHKHSLAHEAWPEYSEELAREDELEIAVQVNGKLRGRVFANVGASDDQLKELALANGKVKSAIDGRAITKVVVIPRKLVNVVVK